MEVKVEVEKSEEKEYGKFDKWEIESAVRTICEAEEIKADPEKMKYVKPLLEKKVAGMKKVVSSIAGLREKAKAITEESESEE